MDFKDAMTEDVAIVFMNTDDFAVVADYQGIKIDGQFLEKFDEDAKAFYKLFWCKASDLASIAVGDLIEIETVTYGVVDFDVDDFGDHVNVFLSEEI